MSDPVLGPRNFESQRTQSEQEKENPSVLASEVCEQEESSDEYDDGESLRHSIGILQQLESSIAAFQNQLEPIGIEIGGSANGIILSPPPPPLSPPLPPSSRSRIICSLSSLPLSHLDFSHLYTCFAYSLTSLYNSFLRSSGASESPEALGLMSEMDRIKKYMGKLENIQNKIQEQRQRKTDRHERGDGDGDGDGNGDGGGHEDGRSGHREDETQVDDGETGAESGSNTASSGFDRRKEKSVEAGESERKKNEEMGNKSKSTDTGSGVLNSRAGYRSNPSNGKGTPVKSNKGKGSNKKKKHR